ncbi:MAG: RsmB/NOP family class I SAM-dependent RNA methyltransferase [Pseudomonadota bacterium]
MGAPKEKKRGNKPPRKASRKPPGFAARDRAVFLVDGVLNQGKTLEALLETPAAALPDNDRALAHAIAATTLRRKGQIDKILTGLIDKPLGKRAGQAENILRTAAAQVLFMDIAPHAAVSLATDLAKADPKARHFARVVNGVLRSLSREMDDVIPRVHPRDILPDWLSKSLMDSYGGATRDEIAKAFCEEPYLDLSVKEDPETTANALQGIVLPTGTVRLSSRGVISRYDGYAEGNWWVQDAAASLAPHLLGDVRGKKVADLCAAPGGKTAFLAARGAFVTAVDHSANRLERLRENLERLSLNAEVVEADFLDYNPAEPFDAVLLDAPCSATGTIRKHPDALWLKEPDQPAALAELQKKMLAKAIDILKPGGTLVFCTCSLQPEEGEDIASYAGKSMPQIDLKPISVDEVFGLDTIVTEHGTIRTLPSHLTVTIDDSVSDESEKSRSLNGLDGFFIARFVKH